MYIYIYINMNRYVYVHVYMYIYVHMYVYVAHGCAGTRCRQACTTHCARLCAAKAPLVPAFQRTPLQRAPSNQLEIFAFSLQLPGGEGRGWRSGRKFILCNRTVKLDSCSRLFNASWRLNGNYLGAPG